jgi:Late embryogenesis abundant protein.
MRASAASRLAWRMMRRWVLPPRRVMTLCAVCALALLLSGCGDDDFKRCEVSIQSIRPSRETPAVLLDSLLRLVPGNGERKPGEHLLSRIKILVTLKVTNPNDRSVDIQNLSGMIHTADGMLGTFQLLPGKVAMPALGTARVEVEVQPAEGFAQAALPLLLSGGKNPEVRASGQVEVSTWLGVKSIPFKDVRISPDSPPQPSPPARPQAQGANAV